MLLYFQDTKISKRKNVIMYDDQVKGVQFHILRKATKHDKYKQKYTIDNSN